MKDKTIYLIVGPSGSGKTTVIGEWLKNHQIPEIISYTTRPIRHNEIDKETYYFVDEITFESIPMIETIKYDNHFYGTPEKEVNRILDKHDSAFIIVERLGAIQFKKKYKNMCKIIYLYSSEKDIINRMRIRGDSEDKIAARVQHALANGEFENIDIADYCIINKDMNKTLSQLETIINL